MHLSINILNVFFLAVLYDQRMRPLHVCSCLSVASIPNFYYQRKCSANTPYKSQAPAMHARERVPMNCVRLYDVTAAENVLASTIQNKTKSNREQQRRTGKKAQSGNRQAIIAASSNSICRHTHTSRLPRAYSRRRHLSFSSNHCKSSRTLSPSLCVASLCRCISLPSHSAHKLCRRDASLFASCPNAPLRIVNSLPELRSCV